MEAQGADHSAKTWSPPNFMSPFFKNPLTPPNAACVFMGIGYL